MTSISLLLFWLPGSIESRRGLFFELVKETLKKYYLFWTKPTLLSPPIGQVYPVIFISKKHRLLPTSYQLFIPGLTHEVLSINYNYLVIGFYRLDENIYDSDSIVKVFFRPIHPVSFDGITLSISSRFIRHNKLSINDGKHAFIAYFNYY
jgi:hypothetical protein